MALNTYELPKNPDDLVRAIQKHAAREELNLMYRRTMWLLSYYYLNGRRRFTTFDEYSGKVLGEYTDANGTLEFQSTKLVKACNDVAGRLAAMDVRPSISRVGLTLDGIRSASVARILSSSTVSEDHLRRVHREFAWTFTTLGCCGIAGSVIDHPTIGLTTDLEVVHPREILPFPSQGPNYTKNHGIMRRRIVTLSYLRKKFGNRKINSLLPKMEWWKQDVGTALTDAVDTALSPNQVPGMGMSVTINQGKPDGIRSDAENTEEGVAKIMELWVYGAADTVARYVLTCGDALISDVDTEGSEVYCPLGFGRFMESGTFHGMGLFDLLFPMCREDERLLTSLFNNVRDIDRYGVIVMPTSQVNFRAALTDMGRGLRVLPWEPDPLVPEGFRPFAVQPYNAGDLPGRTSAFANSIIESLNPIADLIREKGRVDSANGLQFLDEQINRALTHPTGGVREAYSACYRSVVQQAGVAATISRAAIPVGRLTPDLAGAIIDPSTNTISFSSNPLPNLSRLSFDVREIMPRSEVARKQEALALAEKKAAMGKPDWDSFILLCLRENLDVAVYMEEERSAYDSVVRNIITLYGDGESPGQIIFTPYTAKPDFQLRVLNAFMADPRMAVASADVVNAFKAYREQLLMTMSAVLPVGVPSATELTAPQALPSVSQTT